MALFKHGRKSYRFCTRYYRRFLTIQSQTVQQTEYRSHAIYNSDTHGFAASNMGFIALPNIKSNQLSIQTLSDCKCPDDIILFLEKHQENITDSMIYVQAMKECHKFIQNDPRPLHKIFTLLLTSNHTLNILHFNTFFHLIKDSPLLCSRYFKAMTTKYDINPNIDTFTHLIKGCLTQRRHRTAGKYWYLMKEKYKINQTDSIYADMIKIYSKSHKIDRASKIFSEYLQKLNNNELPASFIVFRAYLNAFCSVGDTKGMKKAFKLMQSYKIKPNADIMGCIMNGYLIGCQPEPQKSLKTFKKFIAKYKAINKSEMRYMLNIKCRALHKMIESESDETEKYKLYADLEKTIFCEFDEYNVTVRATNIRSLLESAICLFGNKEPLRVVQLFESLVSENRIEYMKYCEDLSAFVIDLHEFGCVSAKFVLSYCIKYKLKQLMDGKDALVVVCGQGLHSEGSTNKQGVMREFVMNDLLTYKPPIHCTLDVHNKGRLIIHRNELLSQL